MYDRCVAQLRQCQAHVTRSQTCPTRAWQSLAMNQTNPKVSAIVKNSRAAPLIVDMRLLPNSSSPFMVWHDRVTHLGSKWVARQLVAIGRVQRPSTAPPSPPWALPSFFFSLMRMAICGSYMIQLLARYKMFLKFFFDQHFLHRFQL